jgi:hypothetical protein
MGIKNLSNFFKIFTKKISCLLDYFFVARHARAQVRPTSKKLASHKIGRFHRAKMSPVALRTATLFSKQSVG